MRALIFAGSTRSDSLHRKLARAAAEKLRGRGVEVTLADLREFPMPLYDGDLEAADGLPPAGATQGCLAGCILAGSSV